MIPFEEAFKIVLDSATKLATEKVNIFNALGRVIAGDVISDINMPPFNKSAMDGYASRKADFKNELEVLEVIPAGKAPEFAIGLNQCSKIMTGAMIPEGADCVHMVEEVEVLENQKIKFKGEYIKENIAKKAEDIKIGDKLFDAGRIIKSQDIAVLATAGKYEVEVYRMPKIGIISTGDELVEPYEKPGISKIRNSNSYQLFAQALTVCSFPEYIGIALDSEKATFDLIEKALKTNDIVILSGGVSMGDFDYVPNEMKKLGFEILVSSIAIQPGKPTVFAKNGNKYIFGLPGNPVSSFTLFELLVRPFVYKLMNSDYKPVGLKMPIASTFIRKRTERLSWVPVKINSNFEIEPVDYHGSAHINSLTDVFGIMPIEIGVSEVKKGSLVYVRQI